MFNWIIINKNLYKQWLEFFQWMNREDIHISYHHFSKFLIQEWSLRFKAHLLASITDYPGLMSHNKIYLMLRGETLAKITKIILEVFRTED